MKGEGYEEKKEEQVKKCVHRETVVVDLLCYKLGSLGSVCLPFIPVLSLKSSLIGTVHMYRVMTETLLQITDADAHVHRNLCRSSCKVAMKNM